jgi:hypothetical protein
MLTGGSQSFEGAGTVSVNGYRSFMGAELETGVGRLFHRVAPLRGPVRM